MNTALPISIKITILEIAVLSFAFSSVCAIPSYVFAQVKSSQLQNVLQVSIAHGSSFPNNTKFYDPKSISIPVGSKVNWTNNDNSFHTVTFVTEGIFDSGIIAPGNSTSHDFFNQGIFSYYCKIHPYMTAELRVK